MSPGQELQLAEALRGYERAAQHRASSDDVATLAHAYVLDRRAHAALLAALTLRWWEWLT